MSWLEQFKKQKLFSATLLVFTLALGVLLGTALTTASARRAANRRQRTRPPWRFRR